MEILAIQCDQAFGIRSEVTIPGIGMEDINTVSLQTYRRSIQQLNSEFAYNMPYKNTLFFLKNKES